MLRSLVGSEMCIRDRHHGTPQSCMPQDNINSRLNVEVCLYGCRTGRHAGHLHNLQLSDTSPTRRSHGMERWGVQGTAPPSRPPQVTVTVSVIHEAHQKFGKFLRTSATTHAQMDAFTDTGAQTCTSGPEILDKLKIPKTALISTRHKIRGVKRAYLDVIGAVFVSFQLNGKVSQSFCISPTMLQGYTFPKPLLKI